MSGNYGSEKRCATTPRLQRNYKKNCIRKATVKSNHKTSSHLIPGGIPVIEEGRCGDQYALEVESKEEDE